MKEGHENASLFLFINKKKIVILITEKWQSG